MAERGIARERQQDQRHNLERRERAFESWVPRPMAQSKWRNMGATVAGLAPLFRSARRVECDGFPLASSAVQAGAEVITLARRELLPSKAPGGKMPSSTLVSPSSSRPMPAGPLELPAPSVPHVTARSPCPVAGDPKVIRGRAKRGDFQTEGWRRDVDDLSGRSPRGPHANSKQNRSNETGT